MKILNKRIAKGTMVLFVSLIFVAVSAILILTNMKLRAELTKTKQGFHTDYAVLLESSGHTWAELWGRIDSGGLTDVILYKEKLEINADTRGVYFDGNVEKPPLKSGRFFHPQEYTGNQKVAVIGENHEKDIYERDGKKYIEILDNEFEIIGILGSNQPTRLDGMKWIPMDTAVSLTGMDGYNYYIDGKTPGKIMENLSAIEPVLTTIQMISYDSDGNIIESGESGTKDPDMGTMIYFAIIFSFVLTTIFTTTNWLRHRRQFIQVEKLLGYKNSEIVRSILKRYLPVALWASLISFGVILLLNVAGIVSPPGIEAFGTALLLVVISGAVLIGIYMVSILRSKSVQLRR